METIVDNFGNAAPRSKSKFPWHLQGCFQKHPIKTSNILKLPYYENSAMRTYMNIMAERDAAVRERNVALDERRRAFAERDMAMLQRDAAIAERNTAIEERDKALHALQVGDNSIFENEIMPRNYTIPHISDHEYDVKPSKEANGGDSSKIAVSEDTSRHVNVGSSKVWGSDVLNMM